MNDLRSFSTKSFSKLLIKDRVINKLLHEFDYVLINKNRPDYVIEWRKSNGLDPEDKQFSCYKAFTPFGYKGDPQTTSEVFDVLKSKIDIPRSRYAINDVKNTLKRKLSSYEKILDNYRGVVFVDYNDDLNDNLILFNVRIKYWSLKYPPKNSESTIINEINDLRYGKDGVSKTRMKINLTEGKYVSEGKPEFQYDKEYRLEMTNNLDHTRLFSEELLGVYFPEEAEYDMI